jgi:drug/metabolite transporter (DMT)-like permease
MALLVVLSAVWGGTQTSVKIANAGVSPFMQAGIRSAGAALLLLAWSMLRGVPLFRRDGTLGYGVLLATLFAAEFAFIYWGLSFTSAARAVLFVYTSPFVVALGAHWLLPGERLTTPRVLGLACAFSGLVVAFGDGLRLASWRALLGDGMELLAAIIWGSTTLLIKASRHRMSPNKTLFYQLAGSGVLLLGLSVVVGEPGVTRATPAIAVSLVYQTAIIAFASYLAWFWLLARYPASHLSAFSFWTPLYGMLFGWLILGEPVTPALALAIVLVALGIYLVNRVTNP